MIAQNTTNGPMSTPAAFGTLIGYAILVGLGFAMSAGALYLFVQFVKWAWTN